MDPRVEFSFFLGGLFADLPMLLVWVGGLIASLLMLTRAPKPACLTLAACFVGIIESLGHNWMHYALTRDGRITLSDIDMLALMRSVMWAAAWALVIFAALAWRRRELPQPPAYQQPPYQKPSQQPPTQPDIPPEAFRR